MYIPSNIPGSATNPEKLRETFMEPITVPEFITPEQQQWLMDLLWSVYQPHGAGHNFGMLKPENQQLHDIIYDAVSPYVDLGKYRLITASFVRLTDKPGPHIDCRLIDDPTHPYVAHTLLENVAGKQIFLPLCVDDDLNVSDERLKEVVTIFTGQRWFGEGTNFLKGETNPRTWVSKHRKAILDYTGMLDATSEPFPLDVWNKYLTPYVDYEHLEGMSPDYVIPWKLRQALIADVSNIHMASNHTAAGFESKVFLNIHLDHKDPRSLL